MTDDGRDGWDCADWIGKQPWFDGKIGMLGTSYVGGTQHAMALENVPQLTTVIPVDAVSNQGRQERAQRGRVRDALLELDHAERGQRQPRRPRSGHARGAQGDGGQARMAYLPHLPLRKGTTPLRLAPEYEEWLVEAMNHGADDEFWAQNNIVSQPKRYKDMPVYLVGGWYDSWAGNTTANFTALSGALKSPVYLIMGPWIHGAQGNFSHGQVTFGKDAAIPDPLAWRLEWFDHWLKGIDNSRGQGGAVRQEGTDLRHGHRRWTEERERPAQPRRLSGVTSASGRWRGRATRRTICTAAAGFRRRSPQRGTKARATSSTRRTRCRRLGGNISSGNDLLQAGAWDQRGGDKFWNWKDPVPVAARNDVLVFQTEPLAVPTSRSPARSK
jgi:putative CocE/NonD family hydrolase